MHHFIMHESLSLKKKHYKHKMRSLKNIIALNLVSCPVKTKISFSIILQFNDQANIA